MKPTLAFGLIALSLLLLVPAASATPRLDPVFCLAIVAPPHQPGLVYDVIRLAEGAVVSGCIIVFTAANSGLDAADNTCRFLIGRPCA